MEKLNMFTLFSCYGMQEIGIKNSGLFEINNKGTSEINKDSILANAVGNYNLTEIIKNYNFPSREEMIQELTEKNIGFIPEKNKPYLWQKKKDDEIKKYWLACKLTNNYGDICNIQRLPDKTDILFSSFPCTDISVAGKMAGFNPDSKTRSSLLWETIRILHTAKQEDNLPKYVMFENVKNLVSKKFKGQFNDLIQILEDIGYCVYWEIINAKFCGIPQNRERVFIVCIRKDIDTGKFKFPLPFDNGIRLKDILEDNVDEHYYLKSPKVSELIENLIVNNTIESGYDYRIRKLTERECFILMGLNPNGVDQAKAMGVSASALYKIAGNGIVTNCVELIAENLYKAQYDSSYICTDERNIDWSQTLGIICNNKDVVKTSDCL